MILLCSVAIVIITEKSSHINILFFFFLSLFFNFSGSWSSTTGSSWGASSS
jgi:hypothetical protein